MKRQKFSASFRKEALDAAIAQSREAFLEGEAERDLSPAEFLWQQAGFLRKRWWAMQAALMGLLLTLLLAADSSLMVFRSLGAAAPLFLLLTLPELFRSQECGMEELEQTGLYSLRQVYAARLTLFAGTDLLLLTLFYLAARAMVKLTLWELAIGFCLPFSVAAGICFTCLYRGKNSAQALSILLCAVFTFAWERLVLDESLYPRISAPVWAGMLALSLLFLVWSIAHGQKTIHRHWEGQLQWN